MIRIVNLINGEQIIGEVDSDFSEFYNIHDPFYITESHYESSTGNKLTPVCTFSKKQYITVKSSAVVYDFEAADEVAEYYELLVDSIKKYPPQNPIKEAIKDLKDYEQKYLKMVAMLKPQGKDLN